MSIDRRTFFTVAGLTALMPKSLLSVLRGTGTPKVEWIIKELPVQDVSSKEFKDKAAVMFRNCKMEFNMLAVSKEGMIMTHLGNPKFSVLVDYEKEAFVNLGVGVGQDWNGHVMFDIPCYEDALPHSFILRCGDRRIARLPGFNTPTQLPTNPCVIGCSFGQLPFKDIGKGLEES